MFQIRLAMGDRGSLFPPMRDLLRMILVVAALYGQRSAVTTTMQQVRTAVPKINGKFS
jgi:hypothetical protein